MNGLFSNFAARIAFFLSRPKSDRINFSTSDSEVKIKAKVISSSKIKVVNLQGLCGIKLIEEDDIKGAWMIQEKKEAKYSDRREIWGIRIVPRKILDSFCKRSSKSCIQSSKASKSNYSRVVYGGYGLRVGFQKTSPAPTRAAESVICHKPQASSFQYKQVSHAELKGCSQLKINNSIIYSCTAKIWHQSCKSSSSLK